MQRLTGVWKTDKGRTLLSIMRCGQNSDDRYSVHVGYCCPAELAELGEAINEALAQEIAEEDHGEA